MYSTLILGWNITGKTKLLCELSSCNPLQLPRAAVCVNIQFNVQQTPPLGALFISRWIYTEWGTDGGFLRRYALRSNETLTNALYSLTCQWCIATTCNQNKAHKWLIWVDKHSGNTQQNCTGIFYGITSRHKNSKWQENFTDAQCNGKFNYLVKAVRYLL